MKLTTAGESHGKCLVAIIEGLPSDLDIDIGAINARLALRQRGYGRGGRQKIESDKVEILSGVRNKRTLGSPLALAVVNADYANWKKYMSPEGCDISAKKVTAVRPGHADLTGVVKFNQTDARNILERASARETAVRTAAGAIFAQYLSALGIEISGYVRCVCGISDETFHAFSELDGAKSHPLFMLDSQKEQEAIALIDKLRREGDTAGGVIEVRVHGLKSGFGSCMTYSQKLDARLCAAVMSVQAIKGVEIGLGFAAANLKGSLVHDEIFPAEGGGYTRKTNNAGGIEGGMSNGEDIVIRAVMKPIPTLMKGLATIDISTGEPSRSAGERSDVCAICAAEIVTESAVAEVIAQAVAERLGGDSMDEVIKRYGELRQ